MGIIQNIRSYFAGEEKTPVIEARYTGGGNYNMIYSESFDGEKHLGEIGPIIDYRLDYGALRLRSWQSYLENVISKTVLDKFTLWMVSKGLKLQSEPVKAVLESEGINLNYDTFSKSVESRFSVWSRSKYSHFSKGKNLNGLAKEAFKNSRIGGDVLVVLRFIDNNVNVQLIDGAHVRTPVQYLLSSTKNIKDGVEVNKSGEHVAYHVKQKDETFKRIPAKSASTGITTAFLVYGNEFRIDNVRGLPLISVCLETLAKQERYLEAAVGSAEERAKIVYQIIHDANSTGEDPRLGGLAKIRQASGFGGEENPIDINANQLAENVAATTNKSTYNMPIGSQLKALESDNEIQVKEFYGTLSDIICSAVGIPPNVAFSIYNDSFSASRAATKDWEHTITVNRSDFNFQFYAPIYAFWLHTEILKNKIQATGYLKAFNAKDFMTVEAYRGARFIGAMFPHIDPVKEVKAERLKLGDRFDSMPLTTMEQSTELLNSGDTGSNLERAAEDLNKGKKLGFIEEASTGEDG